MDELTCNVEDCNRRIRVRSRGWCAMHYQRWQRHGDTGPGAPRRVHASTATETRRCEFGGCTRKYISKGLCASHNWRRNMGRELTPLPDRREAKPTDRNERGEKQCRTCLVWLHLDMFNRNASAQDGLQGHCRGCARDAQRKTLYRLPRGRYAEMLASQGACAPSVSRLTTPGSPCPLIMTTLAVPTPPSLAANASAACCAPRATTASGSSGTALNSCVLQRYTWSSAAPSSRSGRPAGTRRSAARSTGRRCCA